MRGRERVYVWRYVLRARMALNARSERREFEGALVRIGEGFGCLHPWQELGDPHLDALLGELREGEVRSELLKGTLRMAAEDEEARRCGVSLFYAFEPARSHATIPLLTPEAVEDAVRRGYQIVKVKGGPDYPAMVERIGELSRHWPDLLWRIDFNETLSIDETLRFVQCLTDHVWKRIDFLEDPCRYDPEDWDKIRRVTSLSLAADRAAEPRIESAEVLVVKPARKDIASFCRGAQRLVVTSNMDHPLGQCYAARQAWTLAVQTRRLDICGLQTHELFEPDEFSERLGPAGPVFRPPGGTGLGFDDLLEKLPWKRLK